MVLRYEWRGDFENPDVEALHTEGFGHPPLGTADWRTTVSRA